MIKIKRDLPESTQLRYCVLNDPLLNDMWKDKTITKKQMLVALSLRYLESVKPKS